MKIILQKGKKYLTRDNKIVKIVDYYSKNDNLFLGSNKWVYNLNGKIGEKDQVGDLIKEINKND